MGGPRASTAPDMFIVSSTGYVGVGIGENAPSATLHVSTTSFYTSGTVRVGGTGSETCSTPANYVKNRYNRRWPHAGQRAALRRDQRAQSVADWRIKLVNHIICANTAHLQRKNASFN